MMTKKHYELIAQAIAEGLKQEQIISKLCSAFRQDNPRFNEYKFRDRVRQLMGS